ncbi:uroporphyrinogen-III C-methyltransferase [Enemella evansiae]|uniref:uroporphyrinogen-III C-methyltransferase n=1 Tax=Enemella evansiae TaxID=2016499 RepID=UPI000B96C4ED|nr:uroporphyrinogen-III C-methyltransferase [Enemella evansiae]OYO09195.1 uroporphyrinogen-III C-methyltransferase [Enemella evansiae]
MTGTITLVGGGPGDPELLTVAACRALAAADVVFLDKLAPQQAVADWAPGAEVVDVGKRPGHHAVPQQQIEQQMIARARRGQRVVRLKGGDPFVLGRGHEELQAAEAAGVPVRVIPGISSAVAVPAAAGIPVTHRGIAHGYTVLSGHVPPTDEQLDALVRLGSTLVVLMGIGTLPQLGAGLLRAGMAATTPVAAVERGTAPDQQVTTSDLAGLLAGALHAVRSPAVVVIGEVVRLGDASRLAAGHRVAS